MNKPPSSSPSNSFIPPGSINLRQAVPIAAERWFPEQISASTLTPDELQDVSNYNKAAAAFKVYVAGLKNAKPGEKPKNILTFEQLNWIKPENKQYIESLQTKSNQKQLILNNAWRKLTDLLYSKIISVNIITNNGLVFEVPHHYWGSKDGQAFYSSPYQKISFTTTNFLTLDGVPFIDPMHLDNVLAGRPAVMTDAVLSPSSTVKQNQSDATSSTPQNAEPVSKGGRKPNPDVDRFWIEICRLLLDGGVKGGQSGYNEVMAQWALDNMEKPYDADTVRKKIANLFKVLDWD